MGNSCCSAQNAASDKEIILKSMTLLPNYSKSVVKEYNSPCQIEKRASSTSNYNNIRMDHETSNLDCVSLLDLESEQESEQKVVELHKKQTRADITESVAKENKNKKFLMMLE